MTNEEQHYIGIAWMDEDGTVHLRLRAEGPGVVGESILSYAKDQDNYQAILDHLGGLQPGEYKSVPPWPDENRETKAE